MLLDSGAEASILDTAFARRKSADQITLAGCLVCYFDIRVGDLAGQDAILGMDFMVPAGVWLDLADGTMCFPNEKWIQLSGRRPLYG
ncbi:hypothetical protein PC129_g21481 [Phytophthora cactorum]|uniref:Peptidase A2 domain-containing protein n=1 Tax=Phytophthora cactorum TaxID=29920 RepID=A0A8T1H5V9_9STRA|nr:hypothetical protein PC129_g21481 [Phytophthora cactorum]